MGLLHAMVVVQANDGRPFLDIHGRPEVGDDRRDGGSRFVHDPAMIGRPRSGVVTRLRWLRWSVCTSGVGSSAAAFIWPNVDRPIRGVRCRCTQRFPPAARAGCHLCAGGCRARQMTLVLLELFSRVV